MDMNNKENENVEVLDDFVVDSSNQNNGGQVNTGLTLESSNTNIFGVENMSEPASVPTMEPVAPVVEPAPMPAMEPVASVVEPVSMPAVEPVAPTVDTNMDLMSDFPTTAPEMSEPVVETSSSVEPVVPVVPAVEVQPVEVEAVAASAPVVESSVNATLDSTGVENNVGVNSDQNVTPEYDANAPVTQASEQKTVKGGKNDTLIFIAIIVVIIIATIFALPFIFNAL